MTRPPRFFQLAADFRQDTMLGSRLIARSPGFSAAAILTLAVAIGANTSIFSVVNALLFKPMPVVAAPALVRVHSGESQTSWLNYEDIRQGNEVFADVAAHRGFFAGLETRDVPARLMGELTSSNYLTLLGVEAAVGRTFTPADSRRDLVVLADHVWRARFASDPSIVGRVLTLAGRRYEVVGVMPPGFRGVAPPGLLRDFWLPVDTSVSDRLRDRSDTQFEVVARLKPGIGYQQAAAAMRLTARRIRAEHPELPERFLATDVFSIEGLGALKGMARQFLPILAFLALMTILSGFVLLIGCANIAGLLIGRAAARRHEIAVRLALGAGRSRLVRQFLTESLMLALIGGAAGVWLAIWLTGGVNALTQWLPVPVELDARVDRRVLAYALVVSTLTSLVFGLVPARRAAGFDLVSSLKDESSGSTGRQRLRRSLIVGQIAICSMLLVWSGLFVRSLGRISDVNPGFDPAGVLLAHVDLESATDDQTRGRQIFVELQRRVQESPGVQSTGMSLVVPLALAGREEFYVGGRRETGGLRVVANTLTPGWFDAVRIPLAGGRDFSWADREGEPAVVIVNETLARRLWNGDALGKRLMVPGSEGPIPAEVVGVAGDSKYWTLGETIAPTVYLPHQQRFRSEMTLHARTANMRITTEVIKREMRQLAPEVFVDIKPMTEAIAVAVLPARIGAACTGAFGVVAMLLAALGVYGLVSFAVVQRTRELGIRKAVGARTSDIVRLIVGDSVILTAVGLGTGLGMGALGAIVLRGFLAGVSPMDPATLITVPVLVIGAAIAASARPALRAARVDPLVTLRNQT
jgi:predicted permease